MKQSFHCFVNVKHYSNQIVSVDWERIPKLNVLQCATIVVRTNHCQHYSNKVILWSAIQEIWEHSSQDIIRNLINSIPYETEVVTLLYNNLQLFTTCICYS